MSDFNMRELICRLYELDRDKMNRRRWLGSGSSGSMHKYVTLCMEAAGNKWEIVSLRIGLLGYSRSYGVSRLEAWDLLSGNFSSRESAFVSSLTTVRKTAYWRLLSRVLLNADIDPNTFLHATSNPLDHRNLLTGMHEKLIDVWNRCQYMSRRES